MSEPTLSYIIVNYNSGYYLKTTVDSILEYSPDNYEIIIIDNNSSDFSLDFLDNVEKKEIKLEKSSKNLGFARANNIGAQIAKGRVLFFINPDVKILTPIEPWVKKIISEKLHKIYIPHLLNEEGIFYENCFTLPFIWAFIKSFLGLTHGVWCQGAALMMKRETFELIGGWPEDYFIYGEDLDLFYTAFQKAIHIEKIELDIIHYGEKSTSQQWKNFDRFLLKEKALLKFYIKYKKLHNYPFIRGYLLLKAILKHGVK